MKFLEYSGHGVPWFVATALLFTQAAANLSVALPVNLLLVLTVDLIVAASLKTIFRRQRPSYNNSGLRTVDSSCSSLILTLRTLLFPLGDMFATVSVDHYSFPSGHTTRVATLAFLTGAAGFGHLTVVIAYLWALAVSCSRVMLGQLGISDRKAECLFNAWIVLRSTSRT